MIDDTSAARLQAITDIIAIDPKRGCDAAQAFVRSNQALPGAWRVLALATRQTGDVRGADRLDLEAIAVGSRQPTLAAAEGAFADQRWEEAETLVRSYLREEDDRDAGAALLLGRIASRSGAHQQAVNLARRALLLAPGYDEARMTLARMQHEAHDMHAALATLDELLERAPDHLNALALRAGIYVQLRWMTDADHAFNVLHDRHPEDSRGWMNHAFMLKTVGRRDEAIAAYRRAIAADARNGQAWWGLANLKTVHLDDKDITAMEIAVEDDGISTEDRLHLLFALGKALEDGGRYGEAFSRFSAGARLRLAQVPYDHSDTQKDVERAIELFTPQFFADREGWGSPRADPIFIVSLPRSGSTLVEQILASHSAIEGTEELFDLERISLEIGAGRPGGYLETVASLSRDEVRAMGEAYIASTARFRNADRERFTDKMPSNWVFAGLIRLILPNAKIIDVRRHPLACGVANFTQHFNWGINFSYDLRHIGRFYRAYLQQMTHFDRAIPGHIHHVTHEGLIDDLEAEVRAMLSYLDLPYDPNCLRFYENRRAVHTPSSEQVREPINRHGVDRWRNYEEWLVPLKTELGAIVDHYPTAPPDLS
jgi:tetratricopeptide (TPR) repeat protein